MSRNLGWMDRALCIGADPEIWFENEHRAEAQRICAGCPVSATCRLVGADAYHGVWGGEVHLSKNPGPSPTAAYIGYEHGTDAGYSQHMRDGTAPCGRCQTAHLFAHREWEARNEVSA